MCLGLFGFDRGADCSYTEQITDDLKHVENVGQVSCANVNETVLMYSSHKLAYINEDDEL